MKVLLDSHTVVRRFSEPSKLSKRAISIVSNSANTALVSAATAWELAFKVNLGKLNALSLVTELSCHLNEQGFTELPISGAQASRAGLLPLRHRDPFDRLLVAHAQDLGVAILSADASLDQYDLKRVW